MKERLLDTVSNLKGWAGRHPGLAIGIAAIAIVALLAVGKPVYEYSNSPEFCGTCHTMDTAVASYEQSRHRTVGLQDGCMGCHSHVRIGPIENKLVANLKDHAVEGTKDLIMYFAGGEVHPDINYTVPHLENERCLYCHSTDPRAIPSSQHPVTAADHSTPIDVSEQFEKAVANPREQDCRVCHVYTAHPTGGEARPYPEAFRFTTHPEPAVDTGKWKAYHWHYLADGEVETADGDVVQIQKTDCYDCHRSYMAPQNFNLSNRAKGYESCPNCHRYDQREDYPVDDSVDEVALTR